MFVNLHLQAVLNYLQNKLRKGGAEDGGGEGGFEGGGGEGGFEGGGGYITPVDNFSDEDEEDVSTTSHPSVDLGMQIMNMSVLGHMNDFPFMWHQQ